MNNEQNILIYVIRMIDRGFNKNTDLNSICGEINWDNFHSLLIDQRVFPLIYQHIKPFLPSKYCHVYEETYNLHVRSCNIYINEMVKLLEMARKNNIKILWLKGMVLSQLIYDDYMVRARGDIDLLVSEKDMFFLDKQLRKLGYLHICGKVHPYIYEDKIEEFEILPFPILKEFDHHENFEYFKRYDDNLLISLEVGRNIHNTIQEKYIYDFLNSTQEIKIQDYTFLTFNKVYTLLYLFENTYTDSETINGSLRVKEYIDLYYFLKKYGKEIDWLELHELAQKYQMVHQIIRVLDNLALLLGENLFPEITNFFDINSINYDTRTCSSGYLLNWETNFLDRLFNSEGRIKEISNLLVKHCYSENNPNYANPFHVYETKEVKRITLDRYLHFIDKKYNFEIKYLPHTNGKYLYFQFSIIDILFPGQSKVLQH